jgi:hypothetical protein
MTFTVPHTANGACITSMNDSPTVDISTHLQCGAGDFRKGEPDGAVDGESCDASLKIGTLRQQMHEGAQQENQEQHTTERHRLRDDDQTVQDDAEVAEDVDEKFHGESLRLELNVGP